MVARAQKLVAGGAEQPVLGPCAQIALVQKGYVVKGAKTACVVEMQVRRDHRSGQSGQTFEDRSNVAGSRARIHHHRPITP